MQIDIIERPKVIEGADSKISSQRQSQAPSVRLTTINLQNQEPGEELPVKMKKKILIACLLALTIGNMMINNVTSFLPAFIDNNQWESTDNYSLTVSDSGLIISVFSVA